MGRRVGLEHLDSFVIVEVARDGEVVRHLLGEMDVEGLHEESFSGEVELHAAQLPIVGAHFGLLKEDRSSLVEVADDAPAEIDIGDELSVQASEAFLGFFDPHLACHATQNSRFGIGRIPGRVRPEGEVVTLQGRRCVRWR